VDVRQNSYSAGAGAASFSDLTLLSNDIPAVTSCDDELELHMSDDDDDEMLGPSLVRSLLYSFSLLSSPRRFQSQFS